MDGRLNFTLDRGRFLPTNPASAALGTLGHSYEGTNPAMRHQLADLSRTATPSSMTSLGQYGGRYFPPSSLPFHTGTGYVMDSYLGGRPTAVSDALKSSLHQYPQYWAAQSEDLARQYSLANSVYSPYLPLLHGADPMAALYPSHAAAAALAQAQSPYHRIYDLRTDPTYAGLSIPGGQPAMFSGGLHSPASETLLLPAPLTEGKPDGQSSLEKLSQAVESAGGSSVSSKRHGVKTEPGASKSNDSGKNGSSAKSSETKREKKSVSSDCKKELKEGNVPKDFSGNKQSKTKKDTSGNHVRAPSKTGVVLPRSDKTDENTSDESRSVCDKKPGSPQKKCVKENISGSTDVPKPKAVIQGRKVSETKVDNTGHIKDNGKELMESTIPVTSTASVTTAVTFTTSDSKPLITTTSTDSVVHPVQPVTRVAAVLSSNDKGDIGGTEGSEYLGSSSGPYHTVYSYTQQNKPLKEGSKVHAPTITPEVGTLPSPVVPTCTTTVITAKSNSEEVKCKVEGSRLSCCNATTTSTLSRGSSKCVDSHTQSAKKRTSEGKSRSVSDKASKTVNQPEKLSEQLSNVAPASISNVAPVSISNVAPVSVSHVAPVSSFDGTHFMTGATHVIYPQSAGMECHARDIYGNPVSFSGKPLPFPCTTGYGYDPNVRPIDLSSPKEKKRKDKVKSPSDQFKCSSDSETGSNKTSDHSSTTVPYRDIIHEYGQPRSHVTLLETHLPTTSENKSTTSPVPVEDSSKPLPPDPSQRLWYDYGMAGQQMAMAGRYVYPYGEMQPYYSMPNSLETPKVEPRSAPSSRPNSVAPSSRPNSVAPSSRPNSVAPSSRPNSVAPSSRPNSVAPFNKCEDTNKDSEEQSENQSTEKVEQSNYSEKNESETVSQNIRASPVRKKSVSPLSSKSAKNKPSESNSNSASCTPTGHKSQSPAQTSQSSETSSEPKSNTDASEEDPSKRYLASVRGKKNTKLLPRNPVKPSVSRVKPVQESGDDSLSTISGGGIPVGIAVARQRQDVNKDVIKEEVITDSTGSSETNNFTQDHASREEFLREQKELLENRSHLSTITSSSGEMRNDLSANLVVSGGNMLSAGGWGRDGSEAARQFSTNQWIQAGHAINPALWVGQAAFGLPPTMPATTALDTSHLPFTTAATPGFKLAQDPVTGQLFLIPATNLSNLAYASSPFQHAPGPTQTVMAAQPFTSLAVPNQPITAQHPQILDQPTEDHLHNDQHDKDHSSNSQEAHSPSSSEPQESRQEEGESSASGTPHRTSPSCEHSGQVEEKEACTGPGEATHQSVEGENVNCQPQIAPQTAYIAGYPSLGGGQTYATYSYPPPQISYLYDPNMLSSYSLPMTTPTIPETPVATVKPECPAVRSQGTSPIVVTSTTSHSIPTATVTAFNDANDHLETETVALDDVQVKEEVMSEDEKVTADSQKSVTSSPVEEPSSGHVENTIETEEVKTEPPAPVSVTPKDLEPSDPIETVSESIGAAEVLHKMKHAKIKKDKKKKDSSKKSEKKLEKKAEKKAEKKRLGEKKSSSDKEVHSEKSEKKKNKSGKIKKLKSKNKDGNLDLKSSKCDKDSVNYNPYTDPQILQAADGLELLSALAEKRTKCSPVDDNKEDIVENKPDVIDEYEFTDNPVIDINRNYSPSKAGKRTCYADSDKLISPCKKEDSELPLPRMFTSPDITWPTAPETMDVMEIEMRVRLSELQRLYKQKQKELAKLQPKKDEEEETCLSKRGPGRPRKRKFLSRKSDSQNTSASDSGKSSGYKEPVTKKKKLVEKLVDRVFRKTGRDKSGKSKKSKLCLLGRKHGVDGMVSSGEISTGKSNGSPGREKNLLKKAKIRPFDPLRVKSKKSKDGKKHKSLFNPDHHSSGKKSSMCLLGKEKKSKKDLNKSSVGEGDRDKSIERHQGFSDSSDGDCGMPIKYPSSAMEPSTLPGGSKKKKRKLEEESDTDHSDPTSVSKRRKPGRPKKYCNPSKSAGNTETIVAKKPKHLGLIKFKSKDRKIDMKAQEKRMKLENSSVLKPLYLEEEWCLRRSERIFLSEPSPQPSPNDALSPLGSGSQEMKSPRQRSKSLEKTKPKVNRSKSLQDISHKVKLKYSKTFNKKVTGYGQSRITQVDAYGRRPGKFGQYYVDSDSNTDESSDADDLPLSALRDRAVTPEPRSCVLDKEELTDGLRVLLPMDGLFHEGAVKAIRPPDVYGVLIDGERGNRPHIYSQEEILKEAILDVQPGSTRFVPEGTRVCAYWSQQFSCLYPGTISKSSPNPHADPNLVSVEFDDGDSGRIPFDHIRMLPVDYPHVSYDIKPILTIGKKRRRTTSEDMEYCRSSTSELSPIPGSGLIRWGKYRTNSYRGKPGSEKSGRGGNLFELEEESDLKDNVFVSQNKPVFSRSQSHEKKLNGKKKHKHRNKEDEPGEQTKHKHKKHKKISLKEEKICSPAAIFSGPATSFASLAQSGNGVKSLGTSGFMLQSYEEKTYNWVMRNPLAIDHSIVSEMDEVDSVGNLADSVSTTNPVSEEDNSDDDAQTKPKGRPKTQNLGEKKKADRSMTTENKDFLPTRQLWKWSGKSTKRPGMKGKARKEFYKAIQRGRETIRVGDCAVFLSTGRPNLPFVGRIENFWESWGGNMVVSVKWFYHPEETKGGKKLPEPKGALFQSPHGDENDVQTISHRCEVLPVLEYNRQKLEAIRNGEEYILDSEELYYLAGNYDPSLNLISYEEHVINL